MSISKQFCSFQQAKQILDQGHEQKTLMYHVKKKNGQIGMVWQEHLKALASEIAQCYPAYGAQDLLELMGDNVAIYKEKGQYCCSVPQTQYPIPDLKTGDFLVIKSDESAAHALAAMYLILRKNEMV